MISKLVDTEEPGSVARLLSVWPKARTKGWRWLWQRALDEFRKPATRPGRALRAVIAPLYGATLTGLAFPMRLLWAPRRTLVLFYDLEVSPITFDFTFALANAELQRQRRRLDKVLVVIVPGPRDGFRQEDDDYEIVVDQENRRWRIDNIILPLCRLMPSVSGVMVCPSRTQATAIRALCGRHVYPNSYWPRFPLPHTPNEVLDACRAGEIVRPFQASEHGKRFVRQWLATAGADGKRLVTITLRRYGFMPARNSDLSAWSALAKQLREDGFFPVFVPDTDTAFDAPPPELTGFPIFSEPAWNIGLRMALYEAAWLNMMINNGPFGCIAFSNLPYLMFKILTPDVRMTSEAYMRRIGYEIGVTPPFANEFQKWIWEDDSLPVLQREFQVMREKLEAAGH